MIYNIVKETNINESKASELADVLATAFMQNKMLYDYAFNQDYNKLWHFMHICVIHYSAHGTIHACYNEAGKVSGVAIWLEPSQLENSLSSIKFHELKEALVYIGTESIAKVLSMQTKLNKFKVEKPYCYLFMIAAIERGAGSKLFQYGIDTYKGTKLYWESSFIKDDHSFYRRFGAKEIGKTEVAGVENVFFILENK